MSQIYVLPAELVGRIERLILTTPGGIVLANSPSFGTGGRVYYKIDGVLKTSLRNPRTNKRIPDTEMEVRSIESLNINNEK